MISDGAELNSPTRSSTGAALDAEEITAASIRSATM